MEHQNGLTDQRNKNQKINWFCKLDKLEEMSLEITLFYDLLTLRLSHLCRLWKVAMLKARLSKFSCSFPKGLTFLYKNMNNG
jgi:hypothetical protein